MGKPVTQHKPAFYQVATRCSLKNKRRLYCALKKKKQNYTPKKAPIKLLRPPKHPKTPSDAKVLPRTTTQKPI